MNDEKQPKAKHAAPAPRTAQPARPAPEAAPQTAHKPAAAASAPAPQTAQNPAAPVPEAAPAVVALPELEAKPALPARIPEPPRAADRYLAAYHATLASIGESQVALASDITAMALEMSGFARSSLTVAGDSVSALLTARNLVDAVEAQFGFALRSIDAMAGGSKRIGEIGVRLANDAAKPLLRPIATV